MRKPLLTLVVLLCAVASGMALAQTKPTPTLPVKAAGNPPEPAKPSKRVTQASPVAPAAAISPATAGKQAGRDYNDAKGTPGKP